MEEKSFSQKRVINLPTRQINDVLAFLVSQVFDRMCPPCIASISFQFYCILSIHCYKNQPSIDNWVDFFSAFRSVYYCPGISWGLPWLSPFRVDLWDLSGWLPVLPQSLHPGESESSTVPPWVGVCPGHQVPTNIVGDPRSGHQLNSILLAFL